MIPRSRSAFSLSKTQAYLKEPNEWTKTKQREHKWRQNESSSIERNNESIRSKLNGPLPISLASFSYFFKCSLINTAALKRKKKVKEEEEKKANLLGTWVFLTVKDKKKANILCKWGVLYIAYSWHRTQRRSPESSAGIEDPKQWQNGKTEKTMKTKKIEMKHSETESREKQNNRTKVTKALTRRRRSRKPRANRW